MFFIACVLAVVVAVQYALTVFIIRRVNTKSKDTEEALRQSEHRFRELFENASDIIYTIDLQGNFTSVNNAAVKVTGYTKEDALRLNIAALVAPEDVEVVREMILRHLGGAGVTTIEATILTKDRRRLPIEVASRLLFRNGVPVGVQGIARDVSERRQALLLEGDRRRALEMVANHNPLKSILEHLVKTVERQRSDAKVAISLVGTDRLSIVASNLPASYVEAVDGMPVGPTACSAGSVAYWGHPLSVANIETDPLWDGYREIALAHDLRASAAVPILSAGETVVGVFEVYYTEPHNPGASELTLLGTAARLASVAVSHRELTERLAHQAHHDPLTGLPNRLLFKARLGQAIRQARQHNKTLAVLYLDLDRFKLVNDTLGHTVGDSLLQQVSTRLRRSLRESDMLARTGGDEFVVLLTDIKDGRDAITVAQKLMESLEEPFHLEEREIFVNTSIGISLFPDDGEDEATLQRNADRAMYGAKSKGRKRIQTFSLEVNVETKDRLALESDLHRALERGELSLHYQPQFDLASGGLVGLEALLRWTHPEVGLISPDKFVPVAEECGLITKIGDWVLREACRQIRRWREAGYGPVRVAVNISASEFARPDFAEAVARALAQHGLEPTVLEFELTEGMVIREIENSIRQMERLRKLGVSIAIDDFGTGHSSLVYLHILPVNGLKVAQSFLRLADQRKGGSLLQGIVGLAHSLGMSATAEGVETESELDVIRATACDQAQGFLLCRPLAPERVEDFLGLAVGGTLRDEAQAACHRVGRLQDGWDRYSLPLPRSWAS